MTDALDRSLAAGSPGGVEIRPRLPGAARLGRLDPAEVRVVRLHGPMSRAALLDAIGAALEFPAWFGRTWDALVELLRTPVPPDVRAILVCWEDSTRLPAAEREQALAAFRVAADDRRRAGARPLLVLVNATPAATPPPPARRASPPRGASPAVAGPGVVLPDVVATVGRIHHVALVVRSIDAATVLWRDRIGLPLTTVADMPADGVRIAFLTAGESSIELVEPTDAATGVARFLAAKGEGFHHVCLEVGDLAATLLRLAIDGIELIDTAPRRGAEGPVAFLHPRSCGGVLVELIEAPDGPAWASLGFRS